MSSLDIALDRLINGFTRYFGGSLELVSMDGCGKRSR